VVPSPSVVLLGGVMQSAMLLRNITAGPPDEAHQIVSVRLQRQCVDQAAIARLTASGECYIEMPLSDVDASCVLLLMLEDDGGTDYGGVNTSQPVQAQLSFGSAVPSWVYPLAFGLAGALLIAVVTCAVVLWVRKQRTAEKQVDPSPQTVSSPVPPPAMWVSPDPVVLPSAEVEAEYQALLAKMPTHPVPAPEYVSMPSLPPTRPVVSEYASAVLPLPSLVTARPAVPILPRSSARESAVPEPFASVVPHSAAAAPHSRLPQHPTNRSQLLQASRVLLRNALSGGELMSRASDFSDEMPGMPMGAEGSSMVASVPPGAPPPLSPGGALRARPSAILSPQRLPFSASAGDGTPGAGRSSLAVKMPTLSKLGLPVLRPVGPSASGRRPSGTDIDDGMLGPEE
jgi:hypothetical protein